MVLGYRSKTRKKFTRPFRRNGAIRMSNYLTTYKVGDYVTVKVDSSIHKGMPHHFYHGRTGEVFNINRRAVGIKFFKKVNGRYQEKIVHARVEHVQHSDCRKAFVERITENDRLKHEANLRGERISTKRQIAKPRGERTVALPLGDIEFRANKPFIELH